MDQETKRKRREQEASLAAWVVVIAMVAVVAYFGFFGLIRGFVPGDSDSWAEFGSYLEGVIGPVVGIVTVVLVVRTLEATRDEADTTRQEMKAQLDHFQRVQTLAELQKRLDGALTAWDRWMGLKRELIREYLLAEPGRTPETVGEVLHHPGTLNLITKLQAGHPNWTLILNNWATYLNEEINLLRELGIYCHEYDTVAGNRILTDFYRRRVNLPLRAFEAVGVLPPGTFEQLKVGRFQFAAAEN